MGDASDQGDFRLGIFYQGVNEGEKKKYKKRTNGPAIFESLFRSNTEGNRPLIERQF